MEFFRHCPSCGRRFHVKLESKAITSSHTERVPTFVTTASVRRYTGKGLGPPITTPITVREGKPIIVNVEEFHYMYKCAHCGHEWTETHTQEHRETH